MTTILEPSPADDLDDRPHEALGNPARRHGARIRILHSVGHLIRGGIEHWLLDVIQRLDPLRFEHHVMVWTDEEEAFTADFRAAGATVLPCLRHTNPVLFARNLRQLVKRHGPYDLLHTHGTYYHGYVMLLAKLLGIPVRVAHSHNDTRAFLRQAPLAYRAYAAAGHTAIRRFATAGIGVSEQAAASMFGPGWPSDGRWRRLFCGIDLAPYDAAPDRHLRAALGIPADRFVVGHVGRFVHQKNHAFLLDIAAELVARNPSAHFLLFGDGEGRDAFIAALNSRSLAANFTLVPYCKTLPAQMTGVMDSFILPSLREGLALVAVLAQAAGLPCLFSDTVSREVMINPALTRFLPLDRGPGIWAEAISGMPAKLDNRDPALRAMFRRSDFDIERSIVNLAGFYEESMAPHRRDG